MDTERWQRIQALFHRAAELPREEQGAFLSDACGGDEALAAEVLSMLEEDGRSGGTLLDSDIVRIAHEVLQGSGAIPPIPWELGPYRIVRLLGEGGMGAVYLAERDDLGSAVAIKVLRDAGLSPARLERFAAEQRTLAQLNHPSIARLYDSDVLPDGTPCFVMEYVDGVPLTEYCRQCSLEERLRLFRCVCEAVQYAHTRAVIHRDLKPSNILVKSDGTVRLLDFGIAKQMDVTGAQEQTRTVLRLMTPAYAAPEQIRGEPTGTHTDVYSLGVLLYELLTGRLPFDVSALGPVEAEVLLTTGTAEKPSSVARGKGDLAEVGRAAWADLDVLCLTAMHRDLKRRYGSAEALLRDVDHFQNREPLDARPDTIGYRAEKFVRRHLRGVAIAAVLLIAATVLIAAFTIRLAVARNAAVAEASRRQRVQRFLLDLFQGGDRAAGPAEDLRVISLLDRGVQEAQTLHAEPAIQAELYQTLGGVYQKLGKLDRADSLLRLALDERRRTFGGDSGETAETLVALGVLRIDQARLPDAERLIRAGLAMSRKDLPPDHPLTARANVALGRVLEERGHYNDAIPILDQGARLWEARGPASADLADSLYELANAHFYAGHYDVSRSLDERVLAMHRQMFGARHPMVAQDLINIGAIEIELGRYAEGERLDREALEINRAWYGPNHPEVASNLTQIARAEEYEQHFDDAVALLKEALAVQERVYGPVHPRVASALNDLSNVAYMRDQWDEAEAGYRRMMNIYRTVYGDKHFLVAMALSNIASVYQDRKQYPEAERMFREVVRRYTEALSPTHDSTAIARIKLGRTILRENRPAEAEPETRAGYEILSQHSSPGISFLRAARRDLVAEYTALNRPDEVKRFQTEQARYDTPAKK